MSKYSYIELFAGCGGMSLGLKAAEFELYFANELSPMAGETYAKNILGEDLKNIETPQKTLWVNSKYIKGSKERLTENPEEAVKNKLKKNIDLVATACPYCLTMFDDAIRSKSVGEHVQVIDIVELLESNIADEK